MVRGSAPAKSLFDNPVTSAQAFPNGGLVI
jgi:hypothetical protein